MIDNFTEEPQSVFAFVRGTTLPPHVRAVRASLVARWPDLSFRTIGEVDDLLDSIEGDPPDLLLLAPGGNLSEALQWVARLGSDITRSVTAFVFGSEGDTLQIRLSPWLNDPQLPAEEKVLEFLRRQQQHQAKRRLTRFRFDKLSEVNKRYRRLSLEDQLTGLLNRRGFQRSFNIEWARAQRYSAELACVAIDIDLFKSINDRYGHSLGDWVLRCFASTLNACCRKSDVIGRTGGEEFCAILPNCNEKQGVEWAEKIRVRIAETELWAQGKPIRQTASFGVAGLREGIRDQRELFDLADRALMVAKHTGRNRVVASNSVMALKRSVGTLGRRNSVIQSLVESLQLRDPEIAGHCERVARYSARLADRLGLHENEIWMAEMAGLLHDVGKIGVPDDVLRKPEKLSPKENDMMQLSIQSGYDIVRSAFGDGPLAETVRASRNWYRDAPDAAPAPGPVSGQIVAIADAFDSMTSPQPYREPLKSDEALAELLRCAGTQFDAKLIEEFSRVIKDE